MNDEKHTPEPWETIEENKSEFGATWLWIGPKQWNTRTARVVLYIGEEEEQRANARRIVAAVNAVAGIPTDELESMATDATQWRRLDELSETAAFYANKGDTK